MYTKRELHTLDEEREMKERKGRGGGKIERKERAINEVMERRGEIKKKKREEGRVDRRNCEDGMARRSCEDGWQTDE